jgi:hypothetical protein
LFSSFLLVVVVVVVVVKTMPSLLDSLVSKSLEELVDMFPQPPDHTPSASHDSSRVMSMYFNSHSPFASSTSIDDNLAPIPLDFELLLKYVGSDVVGSVCLVGHLVDVLFGLLLLQSMSR